MGARCILFSRSSDKLEARAKELGKGHSEVIYGDALEIELQNNNINYSREKKYKIEYKGITLPHFYYADFVIEDKTILVIDSLGVYKHLTFQPNYVLLRHSPRLNLNRVIDSLQPQQIIADASNYKSYIARWKATCADKKIPFHITNEKGAFVLDK